MLLAERLVGEARSRRARKMAPRERVVLRVSAALFVISAVIIALTVPNERSVEPLVVIGLVVGYVLAERVRFEFGGTYGTAEQLLLVPLFLLAPLPLVPLIVALAIGLGASRSGRTGLVVLGALCALGVGIVAAVDQDSTLQRDDWRGAAQLLGGSGANRMLVINPGDAGPPHHQAIVYYIPAAHATTCRRPVRELDLLSLEDNGLDAQVQGVPKLPRIPTPAGFRMVGRSETSRFTLIRYRSAAAHASCKWLGATQAALDESGRGKAKPVLIPAGAEPKPS